MPFHPDDHALDLLYLATARRRYTSPMAAFHRLERLGNPPPYAPGRPLSEVEIAIEVFGYLAADHRYINHRSDSAFAYLILQKSGSPVIARWITFFFEDIILAQDLPSTFEGIQHRARVFAYVPYLLGSIRHMRPVMTLIDFYPALLRLFVQGWCKAIDEYHPSWGTWARLINNMMRWANATSQSILARMQMQGLTSGGYTEGPALARILIRHLNHETTRVPDMSTESLLPLNNFLMSLAAGGYFRYGPFKEMEIRSDSIPALVSLISALMKHPFTRNGPKDGVEFKLVHEIMYFTLSTLVSELTDELASALAMLNAGIVVVLMKSPRAFLEGDSVKTNDISCIHRIVEILEFLSKFLIYPTVLHAFLVSVKKIERREGVEEAFREHAPSVWSRWEEVREKAFALRSYRRKLKRTPSFACTSASVSNLFSITGFV
ncbi:hypothetical protein AAF712_007702 [Marasmius tenuissimus]|uniref:Uncharacterized protein n=1 Tax=Marasmius tenuissimus TaxID=585030 RepID=A0ABR2ZVL0_9AGAR